MSDTAPVPVEDAPESAHLEADQEYDDAQRVPAPEWYDDEIDVGELTNEENA